MSEEIIRLTHELLISIQEGNWKKYQGKSKNQHTY
jgi:hypothetical protein